MGTLGGRWTTPARDSAALVNTVQVLVLIEVVAYAASTLIRTGSGFDAAWDGWLQGAAYVTVAGLLVLRPVLSLFDRLIWAFVAAGLALRCAAFVGFLTVLPVDGSISFPLGSDIGWLLSYPLLLAG